jgi:hypothetical protein
MRSKRVLEREHTAIYLHFKDLVVGSSPTRKIILPVAQSVERVKTVLCKIKDL